MKKIILALMLGVMLFTFVSAECTSQTIVGGTIYQDDISNVINGAEVTVTCNGNPLTTTSSSNGAYSVVFDCSQCAYGDVVSVSAQKEALTGEEEGEIDMNYELPCSIMLNVGIVNVPMVPEFGMFVGGLTILGALGAFLIVRRK